MAVTSSKLIKNLAFYRFADFPDYRERRADFKGLCLELGLKGTILLSPEGINGFVAGLEEATDRLADFVRAQPGFAGIEFKVSWSEEVPFGRMLVKLKKEIIPLGLPEIRPQERTGARLAPRELKRWLDEGRKIRLLDTRNRYETRFGTFENALELDIETFRDFSRALGAAPEELRDEPVVMFCTGGIRCEQATAYALAEGYREVYQLEGGILKYFEECGRDHYRGDCFVFDERIALDPTLSQNKNASRD
jgi:predicted sulfurtransferase